MCPRRTIDEVGWVTEVRRTLPGIELSIEPGPLFVRVVCLDLLYLLSFKPLRHLARGIPGEVGSAIKKRRRQY